MSNFDRFSPSRSNIMRQATTKRKDVVILNVQSPSAKSWKTPITAGSKVLSLHILSFTMGFFMARSQMLNRYTPLGVAFTAGISGEYTFAAAIGALLGYLVPSFDGISQIRYMGAVGIATVASWFLGNFFPPAKKPLFCALAGGGSLLLILLIFYLAGESFTALPQILGESLLTAGAAYFFCRFSQILRKQTRNLSFQETACLVIALTFMVTVFSQFTIATFSPGHILSVLFILFAARYGRESAGSITAVAMGFSLYLGNPSFATAAVGFMVGGLLAGVFSPLGKIGCSLAFLVANGLLVLQNPSSAALTLLYECLVATVLFVVAPQKLNGFFVTLFSTPAQGSLVEGLRNSIVLRLSFAAEALNDVSQTVEDVSRKLKKIDAPSFEQVFIKTEDTACSHCSMRIYCWESNKGETLSALLGATKLLRKKGMIHIEDLPKSFGEHCLRPTELLEALTIQFNDFLSRDAAGRRLEEIRGVIAEEFQGISHMLQNLSEEFHQCSYYDSDMAEQIRNALQTIGITPLDISCQVDKYGRLTAEIRFYREENKPINRAILLRELSAKCGKDFEVPTVTDVGRLVLLTLSEKAEYTVCFGVAQHSYQNNKLCGDAYQSFFDGRGQFVMVLSDGMGKGGRAAVDGTMAAGLMTRLLKAGFDPNSALKIVNSAMLYKSTEESLATVDVTVLDLFGGMAQFYKAGAPATILRKNGKARVVDGETLPAGILKGVCFDHNQTTLSKGDIIVMVSDGVLENGTDWIGVELEVWNSPDATALAEHIADYAKRRCPQGQEDDITVAVAIIEKSY